MRRHAKKKEIAAPSALLFFSLQSSNKLSYIIGRLAPNLNIRNFYRVTHRDNTQLKDRPSKP